MPAKKQKETPEQQSARFRAEVERMIAAGELSPTEADSNFATLMERVAKVRNEPIDNRRK